MLRHGVIAAVAMLLASAAMATPLYTAYDMMDALGRGDACAVMDLLSADVRARVEAAVEGLQELARESPAAASDLLRASGLGIGPGDLAGMTAEELLDHVLRRRRLSFHFSEVEREHVTMSGRTAEVGLALLGGDSLHMSMVWEDGGWRISGSRLLDRLLAGIGR
jgi:hypothetical protein